MPALTAVDQANSMLRHLGDQLGLPALCLDEQAQCQLLVARRWMLLLRLVPERDMLYLICPVTTHEQLAQIGIAAWVALLQSQHLGGQLPGASVSVDPQGRVCVQQALHLPSAVPSQIISAVESVLGRAAQWGGKLAHSEVPPPSDGGGVPRLHHARI